MSKVVCATCGKEINDNERVAKFYNGNSCEYTHVMECDNKYDCDYVYMIEQLSPEYYSNKNEIDFDED